MLKPESSLHLHWRSPFPEVKNGGLNFVLGGERDGTHWFGGDVIKEVGICSFFSKTERSFIWKKLLTRLMQFFSTWISFKNNSWTHQIIIILRLVSGLAGGCGRRLWRGLFEDWCFAHIGGIEMPEVYTWIVSVYILQNRSPPPQKMRVVESDYVTFIWCSKGLWVASVASMSTSESTVVCVLIEKLAAILGTATVSLCGWGVVSTECWFKKHIYIFLLFLYDIGGQFGNFVAVVFGVGRLDQWLLSVACFIAANLPILLEGRGRVPTGFGVSDVQCQCLVPGENVALQLERAFVAWPTKCFQTVMSLEPLSLSKRSVHMTENWFA